MPADAHGSFTSDHLTITEVRGERSIRYCVDRDGGECSSLSSNTPTRPPLPRLPSSGQALRPTQLLCFPREPEPLRWIVDCGLLGWGFWRYVHYRRLPTRHDHPHPHSPRFHTQHTPPVAVAVAFAVPIPGPKCPSACADAWYAWCWLAGMCLWAVGCLSQFWCVLPSGTARLGTYLSNTLAAAEAPGGPAPFVDLVSSMGPFHSSRSHGSHRAVTSHHFPSEVGF